MHICKHIDLKEEVYRPQLNKIPDNVENIVHIKRNYCSLLRKSLRIFRALKASSSYLVPIHSLGILITQICCIHFFSLVEYGLVPAIWCRKADLYVPKHAQKETKTTMKCKTEENYKCITNMFILN